MSVGSNAFILQLQRWDWVSHASVAPSLVCFPTYCNTPGNNRIPQGVTLPVWHCVTPLLAHRHYCHCDVEVSNLTFRSISHSAGKAQWRATKWKYFREGESNKFPRKDSSRLRSRWVLDNETEGMWFALVHVCSFSWVIDLQSADPKNIVDLFLQVDVSACCYCRVEPCTVMGTTLIPR